jgi:hypothetical protein
MTSRSLLGMLYIRLLKIWLSSILRTHSLLIFSLNWSRLVGVGLLQLHLHPPPHFLYWAEIRAVDLADLLVCESNVLTCSCAKLRILTPMVPWAYTLFYMVREYTVFYMLPLERTVLCMEPREYPVFYMILVPWEYTVS